MKLIGITLMSALLGIAPRAMSIELPASIQRYLLSGDVTEGEGRLTGSVSEQNTFIDYVRTHWSEMLDSLDTIASKTRPQVVIIAAAEYLPARDYLQFMNKLCDRKAAGKVTVGAFESTAMGTTPKKRGFLAWNYQDQQVRQLVQRLQGMLPQNSTLQPWLTKVLAGTAVEAAETATIGQGNPEPETLAPQ